MKIPSWLRVYGDTNYRGDCPLESAEQATFFNRIRNDFPDSYGLIATHIKNEGKRSQNQVTKDRMQGMTKGASDIIIPGNPTFVCELKRQDHTKSAWQPHQLQYLKTCHDNGAFVVLALGREAAYQALLDWSKL